MGAALPRPGGALTVDWTQVLIALIGLPGVALTGWYTYRLAARRASGKVATTDADALWEEQANLRRYLTEDIVQLRKDLAAERAAREDVERRFEMLRSEHAAEIDALREELRTKDHQIQRLESERGELTRRVSELEQELVARLEAARLATATKKTP